MQEAEKTGAASEGTSGGKQVAGKSAKGKQSQTAKELDPGAYPGKESVGFFRKSQWHPYVVRSKSHCTTPFLAMTACVLSKSHLS